MTQLAFKPVPSWCVHSICCVGLDLARRLTRSALLNKAELHAGQQLACLLE